MFHLVENGTGGWGDCAPRLPLRERRRWRSRSPPACGNLRAQSGPPCWLPPRQQFSSSGGEFSQGGAAQGGVPGQDGPFSLQARMRGPAFRISSNTGTPGAFPSPCPVARHSSAPQSLSLKSFLWLHLWAPGELLLLCYLSALGIREPLLSSGEVLGSGHTGTHCFTPSNASKEVCSPRAISHTQQMGSPTLPPRHTYKIHSLPPCPLAPSPAVQSPSERAGFLFQTFLAEE